MPKKGQSPLCKTDISNNTAFIDATVAKVTMIYLVFKVKNNEMRTYKWIVTIQALLELISATLMYLVGTLGKHRIIDKNSKTWLNALTGSAHKKAVRK